MARWSPLATILLHAMVAVYSLSIQKQRYVLVPWLNQQYPNVQLGWAEHHVDAAATTNAVTVGWDTDQDQESVTVNLPYLNETDTLASTLWPSSVVGAILCRSPTMKALLNKQTAVMELGCGLGLTGLCAAKTAKSCYLTDNDDVVLEEIRRTVQTYGTDNVQVERLDWRDPGTPTNEFQVILATDVAYYYHLLRPLMDTARSHLATSNSLWMALGQANRQEQWRLYHNLRDGCYNQLTDEQEDRWPGNVRVLLYKLHVFEWQAGDSSSTASTMEGTIPVAAMIYEPSPELNLGPFTEYDYEATKADEESMAMTF